MRGTEVRVLDERYLEFIEVMRSLGELGSLARLIADLSGSSEEPCNDADPGGGLDEMRPEIIRAIHFFWKMGWIDVREITRKSKYGQRKNYRVSISLDRISEHFEQERLRRSQIAGEVFRLQKAAVTA